MWLLLFLLLFLAVAVCGLLFKIHSIYHAVGELRVQLAERIQADTNTGIDLTYLDRRINRLAADLDCQLQLLRQKQLQYTRGDQELKTAVMNISHDLRTPLTAIYGYLRLLEDEELPPRAVEYLAVIQNRVDGLKELAQELFRYSVILSVDCYEEKEELSVNAVLEESLAGYYAAILKAGIQPEIRICGQTVKRTLNRQALARIFSNMISNAIKYSDGDLQIRLEADGRLCFSNRAKNLDKVSVGHLFDRFYTVESGRGSTGLGLSIARTLIEEMNGKIEAEYQEGILYLYLYL